MGALPMRLDAGVILAEQVARFNTYLISIRFFQIPSFLKCKSGTYESTWHSTLGCSICWRRDCGAPKEAGAGERKVHRNTSKKPALKRLPQFHTQQVRPRLLQPSLYLGGTLRRQSASGVRRSSTCWRLRPPRPVGTHRAYLPIQ